MPKKIGSLFVKLVTAAVFVAASFVALFYAYGYQYDVKDNGIKKTSIVDVESNYDNVDLSLNGLSVSEKIPFQIKNVDPGIYDLAVKKDGFLFWSRKIKVEQDFVTIVYDVLLYPVDITKYLKTFLTFDDKVQFVFGDDFILTYVKGGSELKLVQLKPDLLLSQENVDLYRSGIKEIKPVSKDGVLVLFNDGVYGFLNVADRDFKLFQLPSGTYDLQFALDDSAIFFLQGNDLYKVALADLSMKKLDDINPLQIRENVDNFVPVFRNAAAFVTDGCVYLMDQNNQEQQLFTNRRCDFSDVSFGYSGSYGLLTARLKSGERALYLVDSNLNFANISNHLLGDAIVSDGGKVAYVDDQSNLNFFDVVKPNQQIIKKVDKSYELLFWYDEQHFVEKSGGDFYLNDSFAANPYLLPMSKDALQLMTKNKTIYYVDGNKLSGFNISPKSSLFLFR